MQATQDLIDQLTKVKTKPNTAAPAAQGGTLESASLDPSVLGVQFWGAYFEQRWQPQKIKGGVMRDVFPARPYGGRCPCTQTRTHGCPQNC